MFGGSGSGQLTICCEFEGSLRRTAVGAWCLDLVGKRLQRAFGLGGLGPGLDGVCMGLSGSLPVTRV